VSTRRIGIIMNGVTGRMEMNQHLILWLLNTPKRAESLEISAYPPYHCRYDHVSFRRRFAALLQLS
jgi:hypothetical protein